MAKPSAWVKPPNARDDVPRVEHDGEGLASLLSYLAGAEPEVLDAIARDLARIVPQVRLRRDTVAGNVRMPRERIIVGDQEIWRTIEEEVPGHRFSLNVVCRALRDHPEVDRWKKMLRPGELWASVGEAWLLDRAGHG